MYVKYDGEVREVGPMVAELLDAGVLVLFDEQAPSELREIAVIHHRRMQPESLVAGDVLVLGAARYVITAVGPAANGNFSELGHIVIKATGASETELPGEVYVEMGTLTIPTVGERLQVLSAAVVAETPAPRVDTGGQTSTNAQDAHASTIRPQRRSLWAFLNVWRSSKRPGTRSV